MHRSKRNVLETESIKIYFPISFWRANKIYGGICRYNSRGKITRINSNSFQRLAMKRFSWHVLQWEYTFYHCHHLSRWPDGVPSFSARFFLICIGPVL